MRPDRRSRAGVVAVAMSVVTAAGLGGCGSGDSNDAETIFVTRTQPAPSADQPSPVASAPAPVAAPTLPAPVDRAFDAALVTSSRMQGEDLVLIIDRLTVGGVDDAVLAASGVPVQPDPGDRFGNQREALYEVAVSPDAVFVLTSCTRGGDGVVQQTSQPLTADDFVAAVPDDSPVILSYTDGRVTRAEVNPRC